LLPVWATFCRMFWQLIVARFWRIFFNDTHSYITILQERRSVHPSILDAGRRPPVLHSAVTRDQWINTHVRQETDRQTDRQTEYTTSKNSQNSHWTKNTKVQKNNSFYTRSGATVGLYRIQHVCILKIFHEVIVTIVYLNCRLFVAGRPHMQQVDATCCLFGQQVVQSWTCSTLRLFVAQTGNLLRRQVAHSIQTCD